MDTGLLKSRVKQIEVKLIQESYNLTTSSFHSMSNYEECKKLFEKAYSSLNELADTLALDQKLKVENRNKK